MLAMLDNPDVTLRPDDLPSQQWSWELSSRPENVHRARHLVEEAASTILNLEATFDLVLAVSEAVTNSIKAGIANGILQPILLTLTRVGEWVTLTCVDGNGQTPEARRIPPVQYLQYHTRRQGKMTKRDWKRWHRRHSLGKGIAMCERLSTDNGGQGFVLVRDGSQVRASLTMKIGVTGGASAFETMFANDIAALIA